jgi:large subunit ribosomal protein L29
MAKVAEYKDMDLAGLKNTLSDLESEYFDLKFQAALSKLENTSLIRSKRRDIARVKTVIHEKESLVEGEA